MLLRLKIDDNRHREVCGSEVGALLLDPHLVGRLADLPHLTAAHRLFLAVLGEFGGEFPTPLVEFLVGHLGPVDAGAEPPDFLLAVGDESDELIARGDEGGGGFVVVGVSVHRG